MNATIWAMEGMLGRLATMEDDNQKELTKQMEKKGLLTGKMAGAVLVTQLILFGVAVGLSWSKTGTLETTTAELKAMNNELRMNNAKQDERIVQNEALIAKVSGIADNLVSSVAKVEARVTTLEGGGSAGLKSHERLDDSRVGELARRADKSEDAAEKLSLSIVSISRDINEVKLSQKDLSGKFDVLQERLSHQNGFNNTIKP